MKKLYNIINSHLDKMVEKIVKSDSLFMKIFILEMILIILSFYWTKTHPILSTCCSLPVLIFGIIFLYNKNKFKN